MNFFKEFLSYSRRERNGIITLSILLLILIICRTLIPFIPQQGTNIDYSAFEKEINAYQAFLVSIDKSSEIRTEKILFKFDPNIATSDELSKLGLSEKQIKIILNFRNKGGKFRNKNDFKKIYGIREEQFRILEPYIEIGQPKTIVKIDFVKAESKKIELNSADSVSLLSLNGIGPAFASRIIKYRNALGGYYKINQLREVFGLDSLVFDKIKSRLTVNPFLLRKIEINKVEIIDLKRHPYLRDYQKCKTIVLYRKEHGIYNSVNDLRKAIPGNDELIERLNPYLKFSDKE
jgi:competence protein ComEA